MKPPALFQNKPVLLLFAFSVLLFGCSQKSEESFTKAVERSNASEAPHKDLNNTTKATPPVSTLDSLQVVKSGDMQTDRFLEYHIQFQLHSEDLLKTGNDLLAIAGRYGFMTYSQMQTQGKQTYYNATLRVRKSDLDKTIKEIRQMAKITSEQISTTDHTETMMQAKQQQKRAKERANRIGVLEQKVGSTRADTIETMRQQNENRQDQADLDHWRMLDRIQWVTISVYVKGPAKAAELSVPRYQDALVYALSVLLYTGYILIIVLPLFAILTALWLIWRKWRKKHKG